MAVHPRAPRPGPFGWEDEWPLTASEAQLELARGLLSICEARSIDPTIGSDDDVRACRCSWGRERGAHS